MAKLIVANGVLLQAPIWEKHFRGTNWLAVIDIDPMMPGGLARRFLNKGKGECLYVLEPLALFDPVEFGADYTTTTSKRLRERWYGVVTAITESHLFVEKCDTGVMAILRAKEARTSAQDRAAALRAERDALVQKAAKIEEEILQLEQPEPELEGPPQEQDCPGCEKTSEN